MHIYVQIKTIGYSMDIVFGYNHMDIVFHLTTNNEDNHCHMHMQYLVTRK